MPKLHKNGLPKETIYISRIVQDNIKTEIRKRNLTQAAVGARLFQHKSYITNMKNPTIGNLIRIASAIGCDISKLLKGVTLKDFGQEEG